MISDVIFTLLTSYTDITDLTSTRIYPDALPEGAIYPTIRYRMTSQNGVSTYTGPLDLQKHFAQFDCYADTRLEAEALARAVWRNITGYRGIINNTEVNGIFFVNAISDFDNDLNAKRIIADYMIHYKEQRF